MKIEDLKVGMKCYYKDIGLCIGFINRIEKNSIFIRWISWNGEKWDGFGDWTLKDIESLDFKTPEYEDNFKKLLE